MKINIFNRDRKGGHKLSPLVDGLGTIYAPSPTVRKIAKQITGRKARREHAKAIKRGLELWDADCEAADACHQWYVEFWDNLNEHNLSEKDDLDDYRYSFYDDDYDYLNEGYYHNNRDWKHAIVLDQWGNLVAKFESYWRASEYVAQNPHFTLHEC